MIRTWIGLVPSDRRGKVIAYAALAMISVIVRAVGTVLLVPLVGALFSDSPHRALGWLGWLTAATAAGWVIDTVTARIGSTIRRATNVLASTDSTTNGNIQYYYKVNATNAVGVSAYSNQVAITSPDRIPQVTPIADVTVNNNQTLQVNVSAADDATDHLTLTASGLPAFATFVDNGNGTGTITLAPSAGLQGVFPNATITAGALYGVIAIDASERNGGNTQEQQ